MMLKVNGNDGFQVLSTNFTISPADSSYVLQVSADGISGWSDLFAVAAGQTRMVTGVANGSFYRANGNTGVIEVNYQKECHGGGGGGTGDGVSSLNGQRGALNLKSVNGNDLIGTGDIKIEGGAGSYSIVDSLPEDAETGTMIYLTEKAIKTEEKSLYLTGRVADWNDLNNGMHIICDFSGWGEPGQIGEIRRDGDGIYYRFEWVKDGWMNAGDDPIFAKGGDWEWYVEFTADRKIKMALINYAGSEFYNIRWKEDDDAVVESTFDTLEVVTNTYFPGNYVKEKSGGYSWVEKPSGDEFSGVSRIRVEGLNAENPESKVRVWFPWGVDDFQFRYENGAIVIPYNEESHTEKSFVSHYHNDYWGDYDVHFVWDENPNGGADVEVEVTDFNPDWNQYGFRIDDRGSIGVYVYEGTPEVIEWNNITAMPTLKQGDNFTADEWQAVVNAYNNNSPYKVLVNDDGNFVEASIYEVSADYFNASISVFDQYSRFRTGHIRVEKGGFGNLEWMDIERNMITKRLVECSSRATIIPEGTEYVFDSANWFGQAEPQIFNTTTGYNMLRLEIWGRPMIGADAKLVFPNTGWQYAEWDGSEIWVKCEQIEDERYIITVRERNCVADEGQMSAVNPTITTDNPEIKIGASLIERSFNDTYDDEWRKTPIRGLDLDYLVIGGKVIDGDKLQALLDLLN